VTGGSEQKPISAIRDQPVGTRGDQPAGTLREPPIRTVREQRIRFELNGEPVEISVPVRTHLADCLRHQLLKTGTHVGCEHGVCGACTVLVDGAAMRSCLMLAVQADGAQITTVEGLADGPDLSPLQAAFRKHHALQCGFCTPGMLMTAHALLSAEPDADKARIREVLSGNLCRCTGYVAIVDAVHEAGAAYRPRSPAAPGPAAPGRTNPGPRSTADRGRTPPAPQGKRA